MSGNHTLERDMYGVCVIKISTVQIEFKRESFRSY